MNNKKTVIFRLLTVLFLFVVFFSNFQMIVVEDSCYMCAFSQRVKEEDYNKVLPDYSNIKRENYATNSEYQAALSKEAYAAHVRQIQQDAKLYSAHRVDAHSSKKDATYSRTFLENEKKPNSFDWSKHAILSRMEKPIYQYEKESAVKSAIKDTSDFYRDREMLVALVFMFIILGLLIVALKSQGSINDVSGTKIAINKIKSLGNNAVEKVKSGVETGIAKGVDLADKTTQKVANKVAKVITEAKQNASEVQEKKELENKVKDLELEVLRKKVKELEDQLKDKK